MSMRVASLDYLGIVAARLRKDAITSRLNTEGINEILSKVMHIIQNISCHISSGLMSEFLGHTVNIITFLLDKGRRNSIRR